MEPAGRKIPEQSPGGWHCATHAAGWMNGTHPEHPGHSAEVNNFDHVSLYKNKNENIHKMNLEIR